MFYRKSPSAFPSVHSTEHNGMDFMSRINLVNLASWHVSEPHKDFPYGDTNWISDYEPPNEVPWTEMKHQDKRHSDQFPYPYPHCRTAAIFSVPNSTDIS